MNASLSYLTSDLTGVSKQKAPLFIRFGYICINRATIPVWVAVTCLIISYFQIFAISLKSILTRIETKNSRFAPFFISLYKLGTIADYVDMTKERNEYTILVIFFLSYMLLILITIIVIIVKLIYQKTISQRVRYVWGIFCYVHPLVIFFPLHNFCLKVAYHYHTGDLKTNLPNHFTGITNYVVLTVNLCLSGLIGAFFQSVIKTKNPLSSKGSALKRNELFQKSLLPALLLSPNEAINYIVVIQNLIFSLYRDYLLINKLIYYRSYVTHISAILQSPICAFSISACLSLLLSNIQNLGIDSHFSLILGLLLTPIIIKMKLDRHDKQKIRSLHEYVQKLPTTLIIQKRQIFQELRKVKSKINPKQQTYDVENLLFYGKISGLKMFDDKQAEDGVKKAYARFLSVSLKEHPKSNLLRLALAKEYIHVQHWYLKAHNILLEILNNQPSFPVRISVFWLSQDLKKHLLKKYQRGNGDNTQKNNLDVLHYISMIEFFEDFRNRILKQVKLQINFWDLWCNHEPSMLKLMQLSCKIASQRKKLLVLWDKESPRVDQNFTSPILLMSIYESLVNNNQYKGEALIDKYANLRVKAQRYFSLLALNNETFFAPHTFFITMHGAKAKLGKIIDCSYSIYNSIGIKREDVIKESVDFLMPDCFKKEHNQILTQHYETGKTRVLNNTIGVPVIQNDSTFLTTHMHIKMNPIIENEITYIGLFRPYQRTMPCFLVTEDGVVDCVNRNCINALNLPECIIKTKFLLSDLIPDFWYLNEVFNESVQRTFGSTKTIKRRPKSYYFRGLKQRGKNSSFESSSNNQENNNHMFPDQYHKRQQQYNESNDLNELSLDNEIIMDPLLALQRGQAKNLNESILENKTLNDKILKNSRGQLMGFEDLEMYIRKNTALRITTCKETSKKKLPNRNYNKNILDFSNYQFVRAKIFIGTRVYNNTTFLKWFVIREIYDDDILDLNNIHPELQSSNCRFEVQNHPINEQSQIPKSQLDPKNSEYSNNINSNQEISRGSIIKQENQEEIYQEKSGNNLNQKIKNSNQIDQDIKSGQQINGIHSSKVEVLQEFSFDIQEISTTKNVSDQKYDAVQGFDVIDNGSDKNNDQGANSDNNIEEDGDKTLNQSQDGINIHEYQSNDIINPGSIINLALNSQNIQTLEYQTTNLIPDSKIETLTREMNNNQMITERESIDEAQRVRDSFIKSNLKKYPFISIKSPSNNNINLQGSESIVSESEISQKRTENYIRKGSNNQKNQTYHRRIVKIPENQFYQKNDNQKKSGIQSQSQKINKIKEGIKQHVIGRNVNVQESSSYNITNSRKFKVEKQIHEALENGEKEKWSLAFTLNFFGILTFLIIFWFGISIFLSHYLHTFKYIYFTIEKQQQLYDSIITYSKIIQFNTIIQNGNYDSTSTQFSIMSTSLPQNIEIISKSHKEIANQALNWNNEFFRKVSNDGKKERIEHVFNQNINMYIEQGINNQKQFIGKGSQNEFIKRIIEFSRKWNSLQQNNPNTLQSEMAKEMQFLNENIWNDLLQALKQILEFLEEESDSYVKWGAIIFTSINVIALLMIVSFVIFEISFLYQINKNAEHFMTFFFKFNIKDIEKNVVVLLIFQEAVEKHLQERDLIREIQVDESKYANEKIQNKLEAQRKSQQSFSRQNHQQRQNQIQKSQSQVGSSSNQSNLNYSKQKYVHQNSNSRKASMKAVYRFHAKLFLLFIPLLVLAINFLIEIFNQVFTNVSLLQQDQRVIEKVARRLHQDNLLSLTLVEVIASKEQSKIFNQDIKSQFNSILSDYKNIETFTDNLSEFGQTIQASLLEIIYNDECNNQNVLSYLLIGESPRFICDGSSALSKVSSQFVQKVEDLYYKYESSGKSDAELKSFLSQFYFNSHKEASLSKLIHQKLLQEAKSIFSKNYTTQNDQVIQLALIACFSQLTLSLALWFFFIQKLTNTQRVKKGMLQIVPIHLLLQNTFIKQYLISNSKGILDGIRHLL